MSTGLCVAKFSIEDRLNPGTGHHRKGFAVTCGLQFLSVSIAGALTVSLIILSSVEVAAGERYDAGIFYTGKPTSG